MKPVKQSELYDAILMVLGSPPEAADDAVITRHTLREARRRLKILLAEDNEVNQRLIVKLMEKRGYEVVVAGDGRQALAALDQDRFDCVLMDVQMPEMDGLQATQAIRAKEACTCGHVPIVAMTAHAMKGDRERCLEAGMDDYLSKPIKADELFAMIEKVTTRPAGEPGAGEASDDEACAEPEVLAVDEALEIVDGDRELLGELAEMFLGNYPGQVAELRAAIEAADAERVMRAAHKIKGALGNLAAKQAHATALCLEQMGRSGDLDGAAAALARFEDHLERLKAALNKKIKK